jgi:hypothetical protein
VRREEGWEHGSKNQKDRPGGLWSNYFGNAEPNERGLRRGIDEVDHAADHAKHAKKDVQYS